MGGHGGFLGGEYGQAGAKAFTSKLRPTAPPPAPGR
jgi:hypothetical protein